MSAADVSPPAAEGADAPGRGRDPLVRMVLLAWPRGSRFALGVLLGSVATGSAVALLGIAAWLLAKAAEHPPITALSVAIVATRALGVTRGVARYLERLVTHDAAFRTLADVRVKVYERLARTEARPSPTTTLNRGASHRSTGSSPTTTLNRGASRRSMGPLRSGDLVSRLVSDTESTQDLLLRGLTPPLVAVVAGGVTTAVCTALLVPGGLVLAAGLLLTGLAVPLIAARLGRAPGERQAEARGRLSTSLVDALHGAPDLVAYGAMERAVHRVEEADAELTRLARRDAGLLGFGAGATALVTGLTVWASLLLGVAAVDDGSLHPVPLAVLVLTTLAAFEIVQPLPAVAARLGALRAGGARLFDVLDTPAMVEPPADPAALPDPPPADLGVRGLKVRYGPEEPWALRGIDLEVPTGAKVAVLGPSGAGKSTLAEVLLRFRDPDAGTVELGGADLLGYDRDDARRAIGGVPQDPHVFASTLRENLRLALPETDADEGGDTDTHGGDERLWEALERTRLADEVRAMPHGLDTEVGVHGTRLSGGMRSRLAMARAVLAAPRILVLDEPTAHLDPDTRDAVMADVLDAADAEGFSTLLITHDLAGLERMDRVYVLSEGRVLQEGTPQELADQEGWYRDALRLGH
ncbi:thiol reductant ABC exporter subunit CydC [Nocardiopsis suaedae]|uniref:Thiol reductant ABC exporter subunit CydC n=1 Tax=Nocardiopsis suaedae TaxID=3018444 RepID=A0ABT4TVT7_9ACTN|nr:thiol reductant ABC exporter subunit CydC [Nocardiopsis suaedae]MDA2808521.1 thiol reductant ABC exporter subunit CydC [Nocardiopsis suaedae]